jgi:hypothetical protein
VEKERNGLDEVGEEEWVPWSQFRNVQHGQEKWQECFI